MDNRLDHFIGTWKTEGQQYASPMGPPGRVDALESYEWLTGHSFVVHRFEGHVGGEPAASIEIIEADGDGKNYPVHTYYSNGIVKDWRLQERGPMTWLLTGSWTMGGTEARVRCTIIETDGALTERWEYATNGEDWKPSWDVKSVRTRA